MKQSVTNHQELPGSEKLAILYDHYKESFAQAKGLIDSRDKVFYTLLLMLCLILLQISIPDTSKNVVSSFISKQLGTDIDISVELSTTILWFALLSLVVKYYQSVIHIQRSYQYVHQLEDKLSDLYGEEDIISREGKFYLNNYPIFLSWTWKLYTIFFPTLVIMLTGLKIYFDINYSQTWSLSLFINVVIFAVIVTSTVLYISLIHFEK